MNKTKAKKLFAEMDEVASTLPFMRWAIVRETAMRVFIMKMRLSTANPTVFNQMKKECQAIGRKLGKSWQSVMACNCVYDLAMHNIPLELGCTVGSIGPYWLRILDWQVPEGIGRYTVKSTLKADDGTKLTVVGFPGFIGVVTAFNDRCTISMNRSPVSGVDYSGVPSCFYTRLFAQRFAAAMNNGADLRNAVKCILETLEEKNIKPMSSLILIIRNTTHHGSIELIPGKPAAVMVTPVSTPLAVTNHLNSRKHLALNPEEEWEEDGETWVNDTYERQVSMLTVLRKLAARKSTNLERVFASLGDPVLNELTAYAVIHDFRSGRILVQTE